ncbi:oxygen-independent coproporphyrinogen III oxidase [Parapedomonas caeni]
MSSIATRLMEQRVPRYTSYPTAPHFHAGISEDVYRRWLAELPDETALSLYVHIPFCDTLCWFCGCTTLVANRYGPVAAYLDALDREMDGVRTSLGRERAVTHIHFGGGSPTLLEPADIERVGGWLRHRFGPSAGAELAIEVDPRGLDDRRVAAMGAIGLTRASIGLQDFNPRVQEAINRIQSEEETASAVARLRAVGVTSVNLDLVYGLPYQSTADVLHTVEAALALEPDRLALFGYAHVPHLKRHQRLIPTESLPGAEARLEQADAAEARLRAAGYVRIGLDHFAKASDPMAVALREGRLKRNFQGYTTDVAPALIGFGASAIGALPQGYVQNTADVRAYMRQAGEGRLPVLKGIALSPGDRVRRAIIEQLMCALTVDVAATAAAAGVAPATLLDAFDRLRPLEADGLVAVDGWRVTVPEAARQLVRLAAAAFDAYLNPDEGRHSLAV